MPPDTTDNTVVNDKVVDQKGTESQGDLSRKCWDDMKASSSTATATRPGDATAGATAKNQQPPHYDTAELYKQAGDKTPATTPAATGDKTPAATPEATSDKTPAATPAATSDKTPAATPEATSDKGTNGKSEQTKDAADHSQVKDTAPGPSDTATKPGDKAPAAAEKHEDSPEMKKRIEDMHKACAEERENLGDKANAKINRKTNLDGSDAIWSHASDKQNLQKDMDKFEERAAREGLKPEDVQKVYKDCERLLKDTGTSPLTESDRTRIAQEIIHQAAEPTSINQGHHNTCNVTTVESRMYTKDPAAMSKMIVDVATTGKYNLPDGTEVRPDPDSLKPHQNEKGYTGSDIDHSRSQASQLAEVTLVNVHYAMQNKADGGHMHYEQGEEQKGVPGKDTGEHLMDGNRDVNNSPSLSSKDYDGIWNAVSKKEDHNFVMEQGYNSEPANGVVQFKDAEDFKAKISEMQKQGKFPVILNVDSNKEPFKSDSGSGDSKAGGSGGRHVVTITGFDSKTGKVEVDNQWGNEHDHLGANALPYDQLYKATTW